MKLLFIISGSIAVMKCKNILEGLKRAEVFVDCIITNSAKKMVDVKKINNSISGFVYSDSSESKNKMLHINLTRNADLIVVCPATANQIAKFAHGYADDLASTSLIASNKQILFIPAMNVEMWNNKINKRNVTLLQKNGVEFVGPDFGYLSCGEIGLGRLKDENKIIQIILNYLKKTKKLNKKKCLVTAGPTIEPIDSVRYISNYSSGIQGYEIAKQLMLNGAKVLLISGPTNIQPPPNVQFVKVKTAKEMNRAVLKNSKVDIAIFTAAVSDVKSKKIKKAKMKKEKIKSIILEKNPDILRNISIRKNTRPKFIVGFAAETENYINNAKKKLIQKKCDLIVLNKINKKNDVFGSDFNQVTLISDNKIEKLQKMTKIEVAKILVKKIHDSINNI